MTLVEPAEQTILMNDIIEHSGPITQDRAALIYLLGDLAIAVHPEDGEWVAIESRTGMFGEGDSDIEALEDLLRSLYELRGDLAAEYPILSDRLRSQFDLLARSLPTARTLER
jgi:hypothetical protein